MRVFHMKNSYNGPLWIGSLCVRNMNINREHEFILLIHQLKEIIINWSYLKCTIIFSSKHQATPAEISGLEYKNLYSFYTFMDIKYPQRHDGEIQEANIPCHSTWIIQKWFDEFSDKMICPLQSHDLNPVEYIWDELEHFGHLGKPLMSTCSALTLGCCSFQSE